MEDAVETEFALLEVAELSWSLDKMEKVLGAGIADVACWETMAMSMRQRMFKR